MHLSNNCMLPVFLMCLNARAGMAIWVLSPFADGGVMRQQILHAGLLIWPMLFLFMFFSGNAEDLWVSTAIGVIAGVLFLFSLKAVLNGYVPLLIGSHPDVIGVELLASPRSPGGPLSFRSISAVGKYCKTVWQSQAAYPIYYYAVKLRYNCIGSINSFLIMAQ